MQVNTCMSSSASAYVPRDCSLEAIPRYRHALRQDRRGLPGRCALGGIYRLAQLMTGPGTDKVRRMRTQARCGPTRRLEGDAPMIASLGAALRGPKRYQERLRRVTLRETFEDGGLAQVVQHPAQDALGFVPQEVIGLRILAIHPKDRHSLHCLLPSPQPVQLRKFSQLLFHVSSIERITGGAMTEAKTGACDIDGRLRVASQRSLYGRKYDDRTELAMRPRRLGDDKAGL
jgi:hypothetical protein